MTDLLDLYTNIKKVGDTGAGIDIKSEFRKDGATAMLMPHEVKFKNQDLSKTSAAEKAKVLKQWIPVENPRFENWMVSITP